MTCGETRCRSRRAYHLQQQRPEGQARARARFGRWYERNASWQCWRAILRRDGLATPELLARVDTLRERGHVPPDEVRALLGLAPAARSTGWAPISDPWRARAPSLLWLPGALCTLRLDPHAAVDLESVRHLHGALSHVLARPHTRLPAWALVPPATVLRPWSVWWRLDEDAERLAATEHSIRLLDKKRVLTVGLARRVLAPVAPMPVRHRVRVESVVPVVQSREGHRVAVTRPETKTMLRACAGIAERLELECPVLAVEDVTCDTEAVRVALGGHWHRGSGDDVPRGTVVAWQGSVEATVNAPALWLLRCAETMGLGGSTAVGFGRVRVSEVQR